MYAQFDIDTIFLISFLIEKEADYWSCTSCLLVCLFVQGNRTEPWDLHNSFAKVQIAALVQCSPSSVLWCRHLMSGWNTKIMLFFHICFPFLFIDRKPTMWPANNSLQIGVLLQITFCSCIIETTLLCENGRSVPLAVREWFDTFSWSKVLHVNKFASAFGFSK